MGSEARQRANWCVAPTKGRARIWQSMRILRRFTRPELAATADTSDGNARTYVRGLSRAGIVTIATRYIPRKTGHQVWMLARDLGPKAPRLRTDGTVWNPNTRKIVPNHGEGEHGERSTATR